MSDTGKHIAILGAGTSGVGAARLAKAVYGESGWTVCVYDSGDPEKLADRAAMLASEGIESCFGVEAVAPEVIDITIISPGIDGDAAFAQSFSKVSEVFIGEIEFAFQHSEIPVIAITGTNGKTTTTELIERMLNACGHPTIAAGNYGASYAEVVLSKESYAAITLEVSSFQLETLATFRPTISLWMNFAPDHMDRYETIEAYRQAKLHIFDNQTDEDFAIVNADEAPEGTPANILSFSGFTEAGDFGLVEGWITFKGEPVFNFRDAKLEGRHNAENVMAAMAVGHLHGIEFEAMAESLSNYTAPAHRCEWVGNSKKGVRFINDSKATNLHALKSALRGQESPVVLIAGGKKKGLDYAEAADALENAVTDVILFGENRDEVASAWEGIVTPRMADSLDQAISLANELASEGQSVLFSPGTSSFDMFTSYVARGEAFRSAVANL